jgi:hypothetical protein
MRDHRPTAHGPLGPALLLAPVQGLDVEVSHMSKKGRITGVILFVLAALGITAWLTKRRKAHEEVAATA